MKGGTEGRREGGRERGRGKPLVDYLYQVDHAALLTPP